MWTEVRSALCFICISSVAVFFFYSGLVTDFFVSKWERRCVCIIYNKIDLARWIPKLIHVQSDSEFYLLLNTFSLVRGCSALCVPLLSFNFVVLTCISSTELANIWTKKCTLPNWTVSHTCQWDVSLKTRPDEGYVWARHWASRVCFYIPHRDNCLMWRWMVQYDVFWGLWGDWFLTGYEWYRTKYM